MYKKKIIISTPISNNRLDFEKRAHPEIVLPSLITWTLDDVQISENIAIECEVDGKIVAGKGLKNLVFLDNARVPTWIMDNHNHAFAFWYEALFRWYIQPWSLLVHIDQHTDLGTPAEMPMKNEEWPVLRSNKKWEWNTTKDERIKNVQFVYKFPENRDLVLV